MLLEKDREGGMVVRPSYEKEIAQKIEECFDYTVDSVDVYFEGQEHIVRLERFNGIAELVYYDASHFELRDLEGVKTVLRDEFEDSDRYNIEGK